MENGLNINIQQPCAEKFSNFKKTEAGGFCGSCEKEVIDFTAMSDREIVAYFKNHSGRTCGHFSQSQLKTYSEDIASPKASKAKWWGVGLLSISLLSLLPSNAQAQSSPENEVVVPTNTENKKDKSEKKYKVEGVVIDNTGEVLPGATITVKGTSMGTITDIDGKFEMPQLLRGEDILIISFVGFKSQSIVVKELDSTIKMKMIELQYCDLVIAGEVSTTQLYTSKPSFWQRIKSLFQ